MVATTGRLTEKRGVERGRVWMSGKVGLSWSEQGNVPKWPLPPLADTMERYLEYLEPLVGRQDSDKTINFTQEDMGVARRQARAFSESAQQGPLLQQKLAQLDGEIPGGCWIEGFWKAGYEEHRAPLPLHVSPGFVMEDDSERSSWVERAASLIRAGAAYAYKVQTNTLPPLRINPKDPKSAPLCHSQIPMSIGSARVPQPGRDRFHVSKTAPKHVLVISPKNRYWSIDALDVAGRVASKESLEGALREVLRRDDDPSLPHPHDHCGPLTAGPREAWAAVRQELLAAHDGKTASAFRAVDDALFAVCLDDDTPQGPDALMAKALHGDGRENRWYDKNVQLVVARNGAAVVNMEHTGYDGNTLLRFTEALWNDRSLDSSSSEFRVPVPQSLAWPTLTNAHRSAIRNAQNGHLQAALGLESVAARVGAGKKALVSRGASPDACVQLAYQLAFHSMTGRFGSTYESLMMKHFLHGRTETLRPITPQSAAFVRASASDRATLDLLLQASNAHGARARQCQQGLGIDRHLYALKMLASLERQRHPDFEMPPLFSDKAYRTLLRSELSTSNCGGSGLSWFGFGPVEPDGLGLGYCIFDDHIHINASSWQSAATPFVQHLHQAFDRIFALMGVIPKQQ